MEDPRPDVEAKKLELQDRERREMRRELQEREKDECVPRIFSVCHFRVCKRFGYFKARILGSLDVVSDGVDTTLAKI